MKRLSSIITIIFVQQSDRTTQNCRFIGVFQTFREADINGGGSGIIDLETMERIEKYYYDPTSIPNNVPQRDNPDRWADWGDGRSNANEDWQKLCLRITS